MKARASWKLTQEAPQKECAQCGVEPDELLRMRERSCPVCGFEADRDANAAWNVLSRGLTDLGVGHSELTPVETALSVDATIVSAKRVVESGSLWLEQSPTTASNTAGCNCFEIFATLGW